MENKIYECNTPVVLIIFNRPYETSLTLNSIRKVKPKKLFVISDGPRENNKNDLIKVEQCREQINKIDWECQIFKIYSQVNLGCMRRVITGLNAVFNEVDKAIVLEDDCVATISFFKFIEWGLSNFEHDKSIGMVCGSNLISHKYPIKNRNGYSNLLNPWGWGSWSRVWASSNPFFSIKEIQASMPIINAKLGLNWWQKIYWKEIFKYSSYTGTIWDFQLQFVFFKNSLITIYPQKTLIKNIGFEGNGTHTNIKIPDYVQLNTPDDNFDILEIPFDDSKTIDHHRDFLLAKEIWHYNFLSAISIAINNLFRFLR